MPRIRTIKPEIWDSSDFIELNPVGKLAFIALITRADDEGRMQTDARHLQRTCLHGFTRRAVEDALAMLETRGMIVRYRVDDRDFVVLTAWHDHQRINRPSPSRIPEPPADSLIVHGALSEGSSRLHARARGPDQIRPEGIRSEPPLTPRAGGTGGGNGNSRRSRCDAEAARRDAEIEEWARERSQP